jgi:hypothetical protein
MWLIWKECNCRIFEDKEKTESQLLNEFSISLFEWSRVWNLTTKSSTLDFISSLSSIDPAFVPVNQ